MSDLRAQAQLLPDPTQQALREASDSAVTAVRANLLGLVQTAITVAIAGALGILNTFGFSFEILPNLLPIHGRGPGMLGGGAFGFFFSSSFQEIMRAFAAALSASGILPWRWRNMERLV